LVVPLHRLLHHDGGRRDTAVVQVNEVRVDRVRPLNHRPVVFILGRYFGAEMGNSCSGFRELRGVRLLEEAVDRNCTGKGRCPLKE